jgi:hypothetical protein
MKHIVLVALVLSVLLVFAVGTAFAATEGDRDPGSKKSGFESNASVVEEVSTSGAAGGGLTGASSGIDYLDSRLYGISEAIR